eukprot:800094-Rhodomonas_salina.2
MAARHPFLEALTAEMAAWDGSAGARRRRLGAVPPPHDSIAVLFRCAIRLWSLGFMAQGPGFRSGADIARAMLAGTRP